MRNTKNAKGFTLVELIVVIAIIGVLAAILVPSMLGFVRDARISSANSNAHAAYTGVQAWLTKYATQYPTAGLTSIAFDETTVATPTISGITLATGYSSDLSEYVGTTFKGYAYCDMDPSGSAVEFATWRADAAPLTTQSTSAEQETAAKAGNVEGCHPLA